MSRKSERRGARTATKRKARERRSAKHVRRDETASLRRAVGERAITFVLGAGVSKPRGVPDWRELTRLLWAELRGGNATPAWLADEDAALKRVRAWAKDNEGEDVSKRIGIPSPHPLADQFAIELLRKGSDDTKFVESLRSALYRKSRRPPDGRDTLGVIARVLVAEQASAQRRVTRVITFNADEHLEDEGNRGHHPRRDPVLWPIARESGHPRMARGANGIAPIPVYHVHGFLPRDGGVRRWRDAPDTLVFTDAEYWATVASPLTFANRVMAQALHDSSCIFIGTSMLDINVIRWLGVRYNAIREDVVSQGKHRTSDFDPESRAAEALKRHFWIRKNESDPHGLIGALLEERGVESVPIDDWGVPFERLLLGCFATKSGETRQYRGAPRRLRRARS